MPEPLIVLDGSSFFVSDPAGDVEPGPEANGYFFADMRHLSTWRLLVNGEPIRMLSSRAVDYYSATTYATLWRARVGKNPTISIRRDRFISDGVHEDLFVENHSDLPARVEVEVRFGSDFADLFEVKEPRPKQGSLRTELGQDRVTLNYQRAGFSRATVVEFSSPCRLEPEGAFFDLELEPR
jgi:glycogen debranching enzyme